MDTKRKRSDSKKLHQCHRNDNGIVVRCTKCKQKNYSIPCITKCRRIGLSWEPLGMGHACRKSRRTIDLRILDFSVMNCINWCKLVHPIHAKAFYLTVEHKRTLKEEYGIEPWTFVQRLGDAVFIPAGCPHQIRNLKDYMIPAISQEVQLQHLFCMKMYSARGETHYCIYEEELGGDEIESRNRTSPYQPVYQNLSFKRNSIPS